MSILPTEISEYFSIIPQPLFPLLEIPQSYRDERGEIINIADGSLGDVAIINSRKGSVRANHYHQHDWHLTYILFGAAVYTHKDLDQPVMDEWERIELGTERLLYTPNKRWHKFEFLENTSMIVVSGSSRKREIYDADTTHLNNRLS